MAEAPVQEIVSTALDTSTPIWAWGCFAGLVIGLLALDLFIFNRKAHVQGVREAGIWTVVWVGLAAAFGVGVYFLKGPAKGNEFAAAYLIEESLSVDNLFIFLVIFKFFGVPTIFQHRVLFWGIFGAVVMRGIMIGAGVELLQEFWWLELVFGGILLLTGVKMFFTNDESYEPSKTLAFRLTRKYVPMTDKFHEELFFIRENGKWLGTPLLLVLVVVETTDLIFAVDSIPACLGVVESKDTFVVYTSNIFAVLGLRALYFLLAGTMGNLRFLKPGLSLVLVFIGIKMLLPNDPVTHHGPISTGLSLGVVAGILASAVAASLLFPDKAAATKSFSSLPSTSDQPPQPLAESVPDSAVPKNP